MQSQHEVNSGDSLNKLASDYGTDWRTLADLNSVNPFVPLPVGELLTLPSVEEVMSTTVDAATSAVQQIDWLY